MAKLDQYPYHEVQALLESFKDPYSKSKLEEAEKKESMKPVRGLRPATDLKFVHYTKIEDTDALERELCVIQDALDKLR
jgi:hypothetical protein